MRVPGAFVLAGVCVVAAGWYVANAQQPPTPRPSPTAGPSKQEIEQARDRIRAEQPMAIEDFVLKRRSIAGLPRLNLPWSGDPFFDSLASLVDQAPIIVVGRVTDLDFAANSTGVSGTPGTVATIQVEQYLKSTAANPPQEIKIVQFGGPFKQPTGEIVIMQLNGKPIFLPGERHVLFLTAHPNGTSSVIGIVGRYALKNGRVEPVEFVGDPNRNDWSTQQAGKSEQAFVAEIRALLPAAPSAPTQTPRPSTTPTPSPRPTP